MSERVTEELVYEYWDCAYCDTNAIRGSEESCPNCAHARDQDITFYRLDEQEETVDSDEEKARHEAGPDWVCSFCNTLNDSRNDACRQCAASRADSERNYFEAKAKQEAAQPKPPPPKPAEPPKKKRSGLMLGCFTVLAVFAFGMWWCSRTHEVTYEVAAVSWTREIPVERYQWVQATDWDDELVGDDVQRLSSTREVRRTEKQQVGSKQETYTDSERYQSGTEEQCTTSYQSTGSGASKKVTKCKDVPVYKTRKVKKTRTVPIYKDVPIYGEKITYKAKRFQEIEVARASGTDNAPKWPQPTLGAGEGGRPDREGTRRATYLVDLRRKTGEGPDGARIETSEGRFTRHWKVGSTHVVEVNNAGRLQLAHGEQLRKDLAETP